VSKRTPGIDERSLRIQRWFEWPMVIAALLVIPAIIFQESNLGEPWETIGNVLNWATWLAFSPRPSSCSSSFRGSGNG
jgi:hypothetical protein